MVSKGFPARGKSREQICYRPHKKLNNQLGNCVREIPPRKTAGCHSKAIASESSGNDLWGGIVKIPVMVELVCERKLSTSNNPSITSSQLGALYTLLDLPKGERRAAAGDVKLA